MEPIASSPKLMCSPKLESIALIEDSAKLPSLLVEKEQSPESPNLTSVSSSDLSAASSSSSSSSSGNSNTPTAKLERELNISQARCSMLQRNLKDAHRNLREREQLLLSLQWEPKDDYYVYRNPNKSSEYLDQQETKLKAILEQMRFMQQKNEELQAEVEAYKAKLAEADASSCERVLGWQNSMRSVGDAAASPSGASPSMKKLRLKSPLAHVQGGASSSNLNPAAASAATTSSWARSPSPSPISSPAMQSQSPRFWLFRKLTPTNSPSMFWRSAKTPAAAASMDSLSLSSSESSSTSLPIPSSTAGHRSPPDVEVGLPDNSPVLPEHDVASPAISAFSSKPTAVRLAA